MGLLRHRTYAPPFATLVLSVAVGFVPQRVGAQSVAGPRVPHGPLRVCADPSNLPFSDRKKAGFENRIADVIAADLKRPVRYFFAPSGPGFLTNTLNADLCERRDGLHDRRPSSCRRRTPIIDRPMSLSRRRAAPLASVQSIDDPALKGHKVGVFSATPPTDAMLGKRPAAPKRSSTRSSSTTASTRRSKTVLGDLRDKTIDAAIVWGPPRRLFGEAVERRAGDDALIEGCRSSRFQLPQSRSACATTRPTGSTSSRTCCARARPTSIAC